MAKATAFKSLQQFFIAHSQSMRLLRHTKKTVSPNKERAVKVRLAVYGGFAAALWAFYAWQPWEFDFIPRTPPDPNPRLEPNTFLLFSGAAKVMVITAHPDDSAFYIGGLLTRLAYTHTEIHQVLLTDGDKGYYPFEDWQKNRRVRREEALAEAATWRGEDILFLGLPDGRVKVTEETIEKIRLNIMRVKPDYVLCFDGDYPDRFSHQDHRRAGEMGLEAARRSGIVKWVLQFQTMAPNYIADISNEWPAKQRLLQIHGSQFGKKLGGIIGMVGNRAERDGQRAGFAFGEGFRCLSLLPPS